MRALLLFRLCALSRRGYGSAARFSAHGVCSRALVRVRGRDALELLQGLVTNDVTLLGTGIEAGTVADSEPQTGTGTAAVYAHMLNLQGRTLYDVILYSLKESSASNENGDAVLLECDRSALDSVTRHLNTYRIRRRVAVEACSDLSLWALLPTDPNGARPELTEPDRALVLAQDPRTALMGWRLVTSNRDKPDQIVAECRVGDDNEYHKHRYSIGVPEGVCDLPPGEALPLESNLVYLNGISFTKGCYLGQELTARTHHTGVVRKRLMPVRFSGPAHIQALALAPGAELQSPGGKAAGKHRGGVGEGGLSLVRLAHAGETLTARTGQGDVITVRANVPDWWPKQGAK